MIAWMLYAATIGALASAAGFAADDALRALRRPSRWVWAGALLVSVLVPLVVGRAPRLTTPQPRPSVLAATPFAEAAPLAAPAAPLPAASPSLLGRVDGIAPGLWAIATGVLLAGLLLSALVLAWQRRGWRSARVGGVEVLVSSRLGPAVAGMLRPRIVLPEWALECDEREQRLMLRHEQEHLAARDPLLLGLAWVAVAAMPWSPAVWWQLHRLRLAVEIDCDARVLRREGDLEGYGSLLLRVGSFGSNMPVVAAALAEPRSFLERRIRAMTARPPRTRRLLALAAAALLASAGIAWSLPAPRMPNLMPTMVVEAPADAAHPATPAIHPDPLNRAEVRRAFQAAYTEELRRTRRTGLVALELEVGVDGRARWVSTLRSDDPAFTTVARSVVPVIRYRPAEVDGRPVRSRVEVAFFFDPDQAAGDSLRVYDESEVDAAPTPMDPSAYQARIEAGSRGILQGDGEAHAKISYVVEIWGQPTEVRILEAEPAAFGAAMERVVRQTRYAPGELDGGSVRTRVEMEFFSGRHSFARGDDHARGSASRQGAQRAATVAAARAAADAQAADTRAGGVGVTTRGSDVQAATVATARAAAEAQAGDARARGVAATRGADVQAAAAARVSETRGREMAAARAADVQATRASRVGAEAARATRASATTAAEASRRADVAASGAARAVATTAEAARSADVTAHAEATASGRRPTASDAISINGARDALRRYHPELENGARTPTTVYFVVAADGTMRRSVVMPSSQSGMSNRDRPANPRAHYETQASGGRPAQLYVSSTPSLRGVDASRVESVEVWRGRALPRNVTVGWIVMKD